MNPLVTIIIPTYNRVRLLQETLLSVKAQTYKNWECIVIDDNSEDNTADLVEEFCNKDERFIYYQKKSNEKSGASVSRNIGLKLSKGKYIQFLDSDDLLSNDKIEKQIQLLVNECQNTIVVCKWEWFKNQIDEVKSFSEKKDYKTFENPKDYFDIIGKNGGFFPPECFLLPKTLIDFSGYWNENITLNDDGEFFFRVISNSKKIIFCEKTHVFHRDSNVEGDNLSLLNSNLKAKHLINSWKIIEILFITKFDNDNSSYINKKKQAVYDSIKRTYPALISSNKAFFKNEIKADTFLKRCFKLYKRGLKKIKNASRFQSK